MRTEYAVILHHPRSIYVSYPKSYERFSGRFVEGLGQTAITAAGRAGGGGVIEPGGRSDL